MVSRTRFPKLTACRWASIIHLSAGGVLPVDGSGKGLLSISFAIVRELVEKHGHFVVTDFNFVLNVAGEDAGDAENTNAHEHFHPFDMPRGRKPCRRARVRAPSRRI